MIRWPAAPHTCHEPRPPRWSRRLRPRAGVRRHGLPGARSARAGALHARAGIFSRRGRHRASRYVAGRLRGRGAAASARRREHRHRAALAIAAARRPATGHRRSVLPGFLQAVLRLGRAERPAARASPARHGIRRHHRQTGAHPHQLSRDQGRRRDPHPPLGQARVPRQGHGSRSQDRSRGGPLRRPTRSSGWPRSATPTRSASASGRSRSAIPSGSTRPSPWASSAPRAAPTSAWPPTRTSSRPTPRSIRVTRADRSSTSRAEVVGLNTAIVAAGQGIGFAIPINMVKRVVDQLVEKGKVVRGWLGVALQPLSKELIQTLGRAQRRGRPRRLDHSGQPRGKGRSPAGRRGDRLRQDRRRGLPPPPASGRRDQGRPDRGPRRVAQEAKGDRSAPRWPRSPKTRPRAPTARPRPTSRRARGAERRRGRGRRGCRHATTAHACASTRCGWAPSGPARIESPSAGKRVL